jgi:hypothetical protein
MNMAAPSTQTQGCPQKAPKLLPLLEISVCTVVVFSWASSVAAANIAIVDKYNRFIIHFSQKEKIMCHQGKSFKTTLPNGYTSLSEKEFHNWHTIFGMRRFVLLKM